MTRPSRPQLPYRAIFAVGLAVMLLFTSTLIALRGVAMLNHIALAGQEIQTAHSQMEHQHGTKPKAQNHLEHCQLCFAQLVEVPGAEDGSVKRLNAEHIKRLWLYAAQARDEFLQSVAARGPPPHA
ncbi:MAG: DUF2946 domain-containing protein [Meiothermus sp.]